MKHNRGAHQQGGRQTESLTAEPTGEVPCSGARRRDKANEVSAAIPGDAVAGNILGKPSPQMTFDRSACFPVVGLNLWLDLMEVIIFV
jgi:hypothetical protein